MADKAHTLTDKKLEQMEKHLSAIYSEAEKEIQKTADEYFAKFAKHDEANQKLLEQGKITEDEYKKWRLCHFSLYWRRILYNTRRWFYRSRNIPINIHLVRIITT